MTAPQTEDAAMSSVYVSSAEADDRTPEIVVIDAEGHERSGWIRGHEKLFDVWCGNRVRQGEDQDQV